MKKLLSLCFVFILLTGCDPIYPLGKLEIEDIPVLNQGESVDIEIIYPDKGTTALIGWENQSVEVISGEDIVSVSGFTITGLRTGTAVIEVKATTVMDEETGLEGREYSTEIELAVK